MSMRHFSGRRKENRESSTAHEPLGVATNRPASAPRSLSDSLKHAKASISEVPGRVTALKNMHTAFEKYVRDNV